jgi:inhibitor of cysteine peptidase
MKTLCALFVLLLGMTVFAGTNERLKISQSLNGTNLTVAIDDAIEVTLDGNPTTGYQWEFVTMDPALLTETEPMKYEPANVLLGSGGRFIYFFKASAIGETDLRFVYRRPFEKDKPPAKMFQVHLTVRRAP